ncbi:MAG TPA: DUF4199 domain-containing protein [Bacteroidia bacterium]|nr:DUF4199 domain-containing protein [Bacteroidia bacterium]HNS11292.1 DUF4199 domain-containing protein [Bacteroidia bacterium]
MENPRTQTKVAMTYGAYYGLAGALVFLLFYFMGTDIQSRVPQYVGYVIMIIFIIMGIKNYRDEDLGGSISYGKSLGTGILIATFGGVITGAFTILFFTVIAPDMLERIITASQEKMLEQGMDENSMQMAMEYTRKFMTPTWMFVFSILGSAFMGLLFSLIISVFMKKDQTPFQSNIG